MGKFLDIIVPQYKETDDIIEPLFASISTQSEVDFDEIGVILVNDGTNVVISDSLIAKYPNLNITYLKNEVNIGQGLTEQRGLDYSSAKYVTFIDADDEFVRGSLSKVIKALKENDFDILLSWFIEQLYIDGKYSYYTHKDDLYNFLHGVFLKRQYLYDHKIAFNDRIRHCEDTYFTKILFMTSENHPILNTPTYLWKYNPNSFMRSTQNVISKTYDDTFMCTVDVYDFIMKVNPNKVDNKYFLMSSVFDLFIKLKSQYFNLKPKKKYEDDLFNLYAFYEDIFEEDKEVTKRIYEFQLKSLISVFPDITVTETFHDFIKRMKG